MKERNHQPEHQPHEREDDRQYYMDLQHGLESRKDAQTEPWYNQRWLIAVIVLLSVGIVLVALSGLTEEVADVSASIQEQTETLEAQNDALTGIQREMQTLIAAVRDGLFRIVEEIRAAASQIGGGAG
jgi:methyl-accepting chemotaxis protein